jgi:hypothetical protein
MSRQLPEVLTTPIHYRTLSLSDGGHANLRVPFSVLRHRGSTGFVVATSSASANTAIATTAGVGFLAVVCGDRTQVGAAL